MEMFDCLINQYQNNTKKRINALYNSTNSPKIIKICKFAI